MSLRNLLRTPLSVGLAACAVAAALIKRSRGKHAEPHIGLPQIAGARVAAEERGGTASRAAQLTRLSHKLLTGGEEEKARIARDLHDGLGSTLTAVNLDLFWVQQRLTDQPALATRLARAIEVLASTVEMKRRIIHSLRPAALDNLGLSLAIESHVAEFEKTTPIAIEMDLSAELPQLSNQAAIALFRIYQEALANAVQHSAATLISVSLRDDRGAVILKVSDDGSGIENSKAAESTDTLGLLIMRERAAALGGTVTIEQGADGSGTTVVASLPLALRESTTAAAD